MILQRVPIQYRPIVALAAVLVAGCQGPTVLPSIAPYRIDVQQGNFVTQEMIEKVKPGMTPSQVRFALGTPLIMDPFHKDRWDYVYLYQKAGKVTEHRRIVVVFKDDKLVRIEGDVVPAQPKSKPAADGQGAKSGAGKGAP